MNRLTEQFFELAQHGQFTSQDVAVLFPGSEDQRYGLIKRAIANHEILHLRRGLYCLAPKYQKKSLNLYAVAQSIYGPSYVSLESALSWHGWIPEAVYTVTSVSYKKSAQFDTPLGSFSYDHVAQKEFFADVDRHTDPSGQVFFMAGPMKALADYVCIHKKQWLGIEPVLESLRVESQEIEKVTGKELDALLENYTSWHVRMFLQGLKKDLSR